MLCVSCSKATTLERTYGPAWIAYGHSFAVESEHDQAMAAYFTAAQLMKGYVHFLAFSLVFLDLMVGGLHKKTQTYQSINSLQCGKALMC